MLFLNFVKLNPGLSQYINYLHENSERSIQKSIIRPHFHDDVKTFQIGVKRWFVIGRCAININNPYTREYTGSEHPDLFLSTICLMPSGTKN